MLISRMKQQQGPRLRMASSSSLVNMIQSHDPHHHRQEDHYHSLMRPQLTVRGRVNHTHHQSNEATRHDQQNGQTASSLKSQRGSSASSNSPLLLIKANFLLHGFLISVLLAVFHCASVQAGAILGGSSSSSSSSSASQSRSPSSPSSPSSGSVPSSPLLLNKRSSNSLASLFARQVSSLILMSRPV